MDPTKPLSLPAVRRKWRYDLLTIVGLSAAVAAFIVASGFIYAGWAVIVPLGVFWTMLGSLRSAGMTRFIAMKYGLLGDQAVRRRLPAIWQMVDDHARVARMPKPQVFILDHRAPAACAWGTKPSNQGIGLRVTLIRLPPPFISAMLAHELAHLKNRDESVFNVIASLMRGLLTAVVCTLVLAGLLLLRDLFGTPSAAHALAALAAIMGTVVIWLCFQAFAIYWLPKILQQHERAADELGSVISGDPVSLALALTLLERHEGIPPERRPEDPPSTHPPLQERVNALMRLWTQMMRERQ